LKDDILNDVEQAFKEMSKVWADAIGEARPGKQPMSYPRFKVLRAVNAGLCLSPDIGFDAGLDRSVTAEQLNQLMRFKLVKRRPINKRSYGWDITKTGKDEVERASKVLEEIKEELSRIIKRRLQV
jgi:hypothetical protein